LRRSAGCGIPQDPGDHRQEDLLGFQGGPQQRHAVECHSRGRGGSGCSEGDRDPEGQCPGIILWLRPSFSYLKKELGGYLEGTWRALGGHLGGKVKSLKAIRTRRLRGQRHLTWKLFGKSIYGSICSRSPIILIKVDHERFLWGSCKQICRDLRHTCGHPDRPEQGEYPSYPGDAGACLAGFLSGLYLGQHHGAERGARGQQKRCFFFSLSFRCLLTRPSCSDKIG
jgi:hypothetical protein